MAMNHCVRRFGGLRGFTVGATLLALIFILNASILYTLHQKTYLAGALSHTSATPGAHILPHLQSSPYDRNKLAFMVETRPLPHLPALFIHMASVIPPEWLMMFMGSIESISFMRASPPIARLEKVGKLRFIEMPVEYAVTDREAISQMFTDLDLYEKILAPAEHLLVFQPDSIFCANSEQSLNDYLEWDWIGAPWGKNKEYGGNGGLSLRKVSKIIKVLKQEQRTVLHKQLEDLWLSNRINALPGSVSPTANISKHFSVERVWDKRPLGYHIGWMGVHHKKIWDKEEYVDHIFDYCPEVRIILGMKLDSDKPKGIS